MLVRLPFGLEILNFFRSVDASRSIAMINGVLTFADIIHANGVRTLQSPKLLEVGVPHGFTTRVGGVSTMHFSSLNLGNPPGEIRDVQANIDENYRLVHEAIDVADRTRCSVHQVHGSGVIEVRNQSHDNAQFADALFTRQANVVLSVRWADCVPILLASEDGLLVAAVHAGWRGVVANLIQATVEAMGCDGDRLTAAIGPCISSTHFEVGPEVFSAFEQADLRSSVRNVLPTGNAHIDLTDAISVQLERAGLSRDRIDACHECTFHFDEMFFSHRRDGQATGRHAAMIGVRG